MQIAHSQIIKQMRHKLWSEPRQKGKTKVENEKHKSENAFNQVRVAGFGGLHNIEYINIYY